MILWPRAAWREKLVFYWDKALNCLEGWEMAGGSSGAASLHFPWQYPNVRMGLIKGLFHQFLVLLKATILLHFIAASEGKQRINPQVWLFPLSDPPGKSFCLAGDSWGQAPSSGFRAQQLLGTGRLSLPGLNPSALLEAEFKISPKATSYFLNANRFSSTGLNQNLFLNLRRVWFPPELLGLLHNKKVTESDKFNSVIIWGQKFAHFCS